MDGLAAGVDEEKWMGEVSCKLLAFSYEPYAEYEG